MCLVDGDVPRPYKYIHIVTSCSYENYYLPLKPVKVFFVD